MTEDFIVDLKDYIRIEHKYPREVWCDPDDVQAAIDEIERLRVTMDVLLVDRRAALSENHDLWREIERLRAELALAHATLGDQTWGRER